jgi:hypothetical protein
LGQKAHPNLRIFTKKARLFLPEYSKTSEKLTPKQSTGLQLWLLAEKCGYITLFAEALFFQSPFMYFKIMVFPEFLRLMKDSGKLQENDVPYMLSGYREIVFTTVETYSNFCL